MSVETAHFQIGVEPPGKPSGHVMLHHGVRENIEVGLVIRNRLRAAVIGLVTALSLSVLNICLAHFEPAVRFRAVSDANS